MKLFDCSTITVLLLTLFVWNWGFFASKGKTHTQLIVCLFWLSDSCISQSMLNHS